MFSRLLKAGGAMFKRTRNQTPLDPGAIRCIVTCELTRLGDVLTTIPALRHLRELFPKAHTISLVDERIVTLLDACDLGIEFVGVPRSDTIAGLLSAIRTVRKRKPDLVLSMSPARRNVAVTLASGAPKLAGYLRSTKHVAQHLHRFQVEVRGFTLANPGWYEADHLEQRAMRVAGALSERPATMDRMIALRTESRWQALANLHTLLPDLDMPFVVIHPFAGWKYREWPVESVLVLSRLLLEKYAFRLIFVGDRSEAPRLESLQSKLAEGERISLFPSDDLLLTAALLEKAEFFIGSDSGPLHLAALLGTPVIGLFGPSTPALTAPIVPNAEMLYEQVPCSPCAQTSCLHPEDHCMRRITPEAVLEAVDRILLSSRNHRTAHAH
jgi:ADP-heptose:LPS heptosyltransferase